VLPATAGVGHTHQAVELPATSVPGSVGLRCGSVGAQSGREAVFLPATAGVVGTPQAVELPATPVGLPAPVVLQAGRAAATAGATLPQAVGHALEAPVRGPPVSKAGLRWQPEDLYIGRARRWGETKWGNPFKVGQHGTAEECVALYAEYIQKDEERGRRLSELAGKRLRCHCQEGQPCHADALIRLFRDSLGHGGSEPQVKRGSRGAEAAGTPCPGRPPWSEEIAQAGARAASAVAGPATKAEEPPRRRPGRQRRRRKRHQVGRERAHRCESGMARRNASFRMVRAFALRGGGHPGGGTYQWEVP